MTCTITPALNASRRGTARANELFQSCILWSCVMPRRPASGIGGRKAIATDEFEFPITTPKGEVIETVREAFDYIDKLSDAKQRSEPWQRVIGYLHRAVTEDRA